MQPSYTTNFDKKIGQQSITFKDSINIPTLLTTRDISQILCKRPKEVDHREELYEAAAARPQPSH